MSSQTNRHKPRRSLGRTLVTTAIVSYGAYRLADWVLNNQNEDEEQSRQEGESNTPQTRSPRSYQENLDRRTLWKLRKQRIIKCREEAVKACRTCWPAIQESIEEATSVSSITKQLKDMRASQDGHSDDLWNQIYVQTITRYLSTAYAHTLVFLMSTLQIHYLGGKMFRKEDINDEQSILVESHQYMLKQGLPLLVPIIRRTVGQLIAEWKSTTALSRTEFESILQKTQQRLENGNNAKHTRNWIRFVLPDITVDELWDIASSPVWDDAQHQVMEETIKLYLSQQPVNREEGIPVAKHMAPIKKACKNISIDENYKQWIALPTMLELGDISFQ